MTVSLSTRASRAARRLALALVPLLGSCQALDRSLSRRFLEPGLGSPVTPATLGFAYEDVWIDGGGGVSLHGWFLPVPGSDGRTVVLLHGSRADQSCYFPYYGFLREAGLQVLAFDYRGYGRSGGELSFRATVRDVERVLAAARARPEVDPRRVGLLGVSLGSIFALEAAADDQGIAAVVVEDCVSPGAEVERALARRGVWRLGRWLARRLVACLALPWGIEPAANARAVRQPLLVIQGEDDLATMVATSLGVHERARGPRALWIVEGAGHAPAPLALEDGEYQATVVDFFERAFAGTWDPVRVAGLEHAGGVARLAVRGGERPCAVHVALALEGGGFEHHYRRLAEPDETLALPVERPPRLAAVRRLHASEDTGEGLAPRRSELARAARAVARLERAAAAARAGELAWSELAGMVERERGPGLPPRAEARLVELYVELGVALHDPARAAADPGRPWLERALAAVPAEPDTYWWGGGGGYQVGWRESAPIERAARVLRALYEAEGDAAALARLEAALARSRAAARPRRRVGS